MKRFDKCFKYSTLNHSGAQVRRQSLDAVNVLPRRSQRETRGKNNSWDDKNILGGGWAVCSMHSSEVFHAYINTCQGCVYPLSSTFSMRSEELHGRVKDLD